MAVFYAWTRGIAHRGKLDNDNAVIGFAETLERVVVETVESGSMTEDLARLIRADAPHQNTEEFLATVAENLRRALA